MPKHKKIKIVAVVGPTATGKSKLAVRLSEKFCGEVVSADSRQVYRDLDIGTGKITEKETRGVLHHCIGIADPRTRFSAAEYRKVAKLAITTISNRGNLPIICGGTGFYIHALIDDIALPSVPPNKTLREKLELKTPTQLLQELSSLDPARAAKIDKHNKRRIIRAIEIARALGSVPVVHNPPMQSGENYDCVFVGLDMSDDELEAKINKRLASRMNEGMIEEVRSLHADGLSWKRLDELGLEYRYIAMHLQGELSMVELIETLRHKIWQYAKRQRTWFKRDKRIHWFEPRDTELIERLVKILVCNRKA